MTCVSGHNELDIYGSEGCCDGPYNLRYKVNGGDWAIVDGDNFEAVTTRCCCNEGHDDMCTCRGDDYDGSSCADVCEGATMDECPYDDMTCYDVTFYD